ncbi:MAG: 3-hydroxybutyryl-CoA dehydrogenase [Acidobacteria bacterium]|nr:3-hydroxybutyryl-CoA dehydrogenase [Acidobacteriota bacterium]
MKISRIGVIGAGTMGAGIAEVSLRAGCPTVVVEADDNAAQVGRDRIAESLQRLVDRSKLSTNDADAALANLETSSQIESVANCDLVIEAAVEDEAIKLELFEHIDASLGADAILASNTSSIPIINLAMATRRPDKVVGLHFFNPATVQPLVEIVRALTTSDETMAQIDEFATTTLSKTTIEAPDRAGFIVNRLLIPYLLSAVRMFDDGVATRDDIDAGMRGGCAHPMGPLELCDLIGLDIVKAVADVLFEEFASAECISPPLLNRMVAAGRLGRKTECGFYDYNG